jgi:hypothetical protein
LITFFKVFRASQQCSQMPPVIWDIIKWSGVLQKSILSQSWQIGLTLPLIHPNNLLQIIQYRPILLYLPLFRFLLKNGGPTGSRGCLQVIIGGIEKFLNDFLIKEASRAKCDGLSWVELVEGIRGVSV